MLEFICAVYIIMAGAFSFAYKYVTAQRIAGNAAASGGVETKAGLDKYHGWTLVFSCFRQILSG